MRINMGYRIKRVRRFRRMTQAELGRHLGFSDSTADIRVAQYEAGSRRPKEDCIKSIADVLKINPNALLVPDINSVNDVFHILFALEDFCGLKTTVLGNRLCLAFEENSGNNEKLIRFLIDWKKQLNALQRGEISREEYDNWRFNYFVAEI